MAGNSVRFNASLDDKVSGKLDRIRDKFDQLGGKGASASLFGNVGAKAIAKGFDLVSGAAFQLGSVLGDSINAAIEEEASIKKLDTALRANVKGWDGNTAAIEATLTARMKLGFSDDEQRQSLALLVAATNDVSKSLDIQRTAMDLAALKGISLEQATEALIKVDDGHYRALQALGIVLPANATSTQALAAVQKVAEGQAAALANTTGGKLKNAQIQLGEAMEKLGGAIMPVVADAATALTNAFLVLSGDPSVKLTGAAKTIVDVLRYLYRNIQDIIGGIGDMISAIDRGLKKLGELLGTIYKVHTAQEGINYHTTGQVPGRAEGGWAGLQGPELIRVGERGPERVTRAEDLRSSSRNGGGLTIQGVTERELTDMVDRGMYFRLRRAAPVTGRL